MRRNSVVGSAGSSVLAGVAGLGTTADPGSNPEAAARPFGFAFFAFFRHGRSARPARIAGDGRNTLPGSNPSLGESFSRSTGSWLDERGCDRIATGWAAAPHRASRGTETLDIGPGTGSNGFRLRYSLRFLKYARLLPSECSKTFGAWRTRTTARERYRPSRRIWLGICRLAEVR